MNKLFIGLAALALSAGAAQAQEAQPAPQQQKEKHSFHHRGQGMRHGHGHDQALAKKLHFSDQQKQQFKDINTKYRQQLTELKKNEDITVREQKARMAAIHKEHKEQMQALFTPEQKAQLQKMKEDRKELAKVNAKARAEKMKIKLGLSDEQAKQLKDMHAGTFAKMKQIREDKSLSADQKKDQVKSLVKDQHEQLKSVLTPEQLKQLEGMRHGRQGRDREGREKEWSK